MPVVFVLEHLNKFEHTLGNKIYVRSEDGPRDVTIRGLRPRSRHDLFTLFPNTGLVSSRVARMQYSISATNPEELQAHEQVIGDLIAMGQTVVYMRNLSPEMYKQWPNNWLAGIRVHRARSAQEDFFRLVRSR